MKFEDLTKEGKLRFDLISQAGFELNEIPLVMRFIKGDDTALEEWEEFRKWKEKKMIEESIILYLGKG